MVLAAPGAMDSFRSCLLQMSLVSSCLPLTHASRHGMSLCMDMVPMWPLLSTRSSGHFIIVQWTRGTLPLGASLTVPPTPSRLALPTATCLRTLSRFHQALWHPQDGRDCRVSLSHMVRKIWFSPWNSVADGSYGN